MSLALRYVGVPQGDVEIPGLCISATSEQEALEIAELVRDYFELRGPKEIMTIQFNEISPERYEFTLNFNNSLGRVNVSGVDEEIPRKIREGLSNVANYVVLLGYHKNDDFELVDPQIFHLFRSAIDINGTTITGHDREKIDWSNIF